MSNCDCMILKCNNRTTALHRLLSFPDKLLIRLLLALQPHKPVCFPKDNSTNFCSNDFSHDKECFANKPWCYTMDPNVKWEYCDIPMCEERKLIIIK